MVVRKRHFIRKPQRLLIMDDILSQKHYDFIFSINSIRYDTLSAHIRIPTEESKTLQK